MAGSIMSKVASQTDINNSEHYTAEASRLLEKAEKNATESSKYGSESNKATVKPDINYEYYASEARKLLDGAKKFAADVSKDEDEAKKFAADTFDAQFFTKNAQINKYNLMISINKAQLMIHNVNLLTLIHKIKIYKEDLLKETVDEAQTYDAMVQEYESFVQIKEEMAQICDTIVQTSQAKTKAYEEISQFCEANAKSKGELPQIFCDAVNQTCYSMTNMLRSSEYKFASQLNSTEASNYQKEASKYRESATIYRDYIARCRTYATRNKPNTIKVQPALSEAKISKREQFTQRLPARAESKPNINKVACSRCGRYYLKRGVNIHMRSCKIKK